MVGPAGGPPNPRDPNIEEQIRHLHERYRHYNYLLGLLVIGPFIGVFLSRVIGLQTILILLANARERIRVHRIPTTPEDNKISLVLSSVIWLESGVYEELPAGDPAPVSGVCCGARIMVTDTSALSTLQFSTHGVVLLISAYIEQQQRLQTPDGLVGYGVRL
ncbi:hypothetical protein BDV33DRAFT_202048 [Aspergillus novoparasiticus]|uniref:Uncharacterized protein n=1 Tax=Aspergillus novoparasiticus TaxID=986946 RepID=A0A5N6EY47_9EURO|nr:hypothetical protein BDV33DRAFT_202048 [Aspergillus novoparasiticus]